MTAEAPPRLVDVRWPLATPARLLHLAPWAALVVMTCAAAIDFSWLSVSRHLAFQSHAFDLGNMDQAAWSTLHGHLLRFTDMAVGRSVLTARLAIHVEPLLALLSLLYLVREGPETLLVLQAVIVSIGAIPAYMLAREVLGGAWLSLAFPAVYLLHPSLQNALLDDFHPVTLSASVLLWAVFFIQRRWAAAFGVCAVLAMGMKEEVGLLVAMLGLWLLLRGSLRLGAACLAGGAGWFLFAVLIVIPAANPSHHSPYISRYAYLGHGLGGIASSVVRHPGVVAGTLTSGDRLSYLVYLLHPAGFVPVLAFPVLLLALPALLINMLSSDYRMYTGFYQYSAEVLPFVIAAGVYAVAYVQRAAQRLRVPAAPWASRALVGLMLLAALVDTRRYGFSQLASGYSAPTPGPHQSLENRLLELIPDTASVSAADEIEPHVAHRSWVYLAPTVHPANGPAAGYVALDASIPSSPIEPHTLRSLAARLLRHGYSVRAASDGVLILHRGRGSTHVPASFYSFIFRRPPTRMTPLARWGPLRLIGLVVHPGGGQLTRARPDAGVDAYWTIDEPLPRSARISFYLSPVYAGAHPPLAVRWYRDGDSPTWDWLPLNMWPVGRAVRTFSLPLITPFGASGRVDVGIGVEGLGRANGKLPATRGSRGTVVRVATLDVGG